MKSCEDDAPTGKSMEHKDGFDPHGGSDGAVHHGGHYAGSAALAFYRDKHGNEIPRLGEYSYGHSQDGPDYESGHYAKK